MTALDLSLFHFFNGTLTAAWLDPVMVLVTDSRPWKVILLTIALFLAIRRDRTSRLAALSLGLSLLLSDVIASQLLKPFFMRERPCHALEEIRLLVSCRGRNGFPSNHAANAAAAAAALGIFFPVSLRVTVPLAVLVGWSRVYVGVHYPADVLFGFLLGALVAVLVAFPLRRYRRRLAESAYVN